MIKRLFLLFLIFYGSIFYSQNNKLSTQSKVSVFTCGRGEELYTAFGHTAIRIQDPVNHLDIVYNYGAFDFRTSNFYLKFVKGDLQYFINATTYNDFIDEYSYTNRQVIEQTLNFSLQKKQILFDKLNQSLFSEDKYYTYKFIDRNCTTMVADKINEALGVKLIQKVPNTSDNTYREILYPYFENHFYYKLGINIIFGSRVDQEAKQLFLPIELMNSLDRIEISGKKLVEKKEVLIKGNSEKSDFSFFYSIYCVIPVLLLLLFLNNKKIVIIYLFVLGLLGLFLSLVGLYSLHKELLWNYNILLFNPLFLILPFLKNMWYKRILIILLIQMGIYLFIIITKPHFILMLPFILSTTYILVSFLRKRIIQNY